MWTWNCYLTGRMSYRRDWGIIGHVVLAIDGPDCLEWDYQTNTVQCRYNTVNFLPNPCKLYPVAPLERYMGRNLWFDTLICMNYRVILDRDGFIWLYLTLVISMTQRKISVTPLRYQWIYHSLALSHRLINVTDTVLYRWLSTRLQYLQSFPRHMLNIQSCNHTYTIKVIKRAQG